MKKFLKIFGIVLGVILLLLFLTPFLFEKQLKELVQNTLNDNLDAKVAFADMNLSLFRNFPDATLSIEDLEIINNAPFEGDTLVYSEEVTLEMSVMELFNGTGQPMHVDELQINNTVMNLKIDSLGNNNYDIVVEENAPIADSTTAGDGFQFDVEHYEINNSMVNYHDKKSDIKLKVENLDHEGTGDFSANISDLSTYSNALVSFTMDSINYLDQNKVELEADFKMDLEQMKFTFLENQALINKLPLTFEGYVQVNEDNNEMDLSFKTPSSSFKNFLAVMPEAYSKNIENVETSGDFTVKGDIVGIVDETHIPKLNIQINSDNASFKYPDLPKSVEDITIAAAVVNETGIAEDTYIEIDTLNFRIDQDVFRAKGAIQNLTENMLVDLTVNGTINLANLEKAYPLDLEQDLNGMLYADLSTSFDMNSIENEQYQNVNSNGTATITNFSYVSPEIPNEVKIETATLNLNPGNVQLEEMTATTGKTDLSITGSLQNLMGFLFTDQVLKGDFQVNSNTFAVGDFMVAETEETTTEEDKNEEPPAETPTGEEAIKIPAFLDAQLAFNANRVLYDNLVLEGVKGNLAIVNETAKLNNVTANIFNGNFALNGSVSTQQETPTFTMDLALQAINIVQAFDGLELLQKLAPIAGALQGELTTSIALNGKLNDDFTPKLQTIAGEALAEILGTDIDPKKTPLLAALDNQLNFIDLSKLNLDELKTHLTFTDGMVEVAPFDFDVQGIHVTAQGTHGFDMSMNYKVTLELPAELLGSEIGGALAQLTTQDLKAMTVPLPVGITGTFKNPSISLNMESAISSLSQKIIANQKDDLKEKGKNILGNILTGNKETPQDSTATGQSTPADTTTTKEEVVKDVAKGILGEIFKGKKKERDTSVNN